MPQVPYKSYPGSAPQNIPTPNVNVNVPDAAFGGASARAMETVGRATSHLGQVAEGAGNELFARAMAMQDLKNETEAKEADTKYMIRAGELHAEYSSLQGETADAALPKYMKDLQDSRKEIRQGLSNDMAKKLYDGNSLSTMGRSIFNGAGHAATERKKWAAGASVSRIDAAKDQVLHNPNDDAAFEQGVGIIEAEVRGTQSSIAGWSTEKTDEMVAKDISGLAANRIIGTARVEPFKAKELLEANRERLYGPDLERVERIVQSQMRTVGARNISDEVNADLKTNPEDSKKSLQLRLDEAQAKAEKIAPDDPVFQDYTRARVIADYNQAKSVKRDYDIDNHNTISGAIVGNNTKGKLPTTVEELTADPKVRTAWEAIGEKKQRAYLNDLAKNAKGDVPRTQETLKRYQSLKGMAQSDPLEFMNQNVLDENLPYSDKRELVNLQVKLKSKAEGDPRITHSLQVLRPMLTSAGLDRSKDKEGYDQFVGSLQDALDTWQKDNKKLPNAKEINEIGSRLLQNQSSPGSLFGDLWKRSDPLYSLPVPEPVANRIKADPFWQQRGIEPTDADIQRIYVREQYNKLYGGKKASEPTPQVPKQ